ncbi:MAG TPA: glycosyltransferase family 4 protein, partial [Candidatus Sulfotelmatobacter sp.]|nr:glycosyltransferase family 4 protein [Candidatus Sulfotelmatobacter sp.]
PSYYEGINERVTYWLERGLHDLRELVPLADLCIGDSTFNAEELASRGARRCAVIPPPVDLERLHPRPATPGQPPRVLFVGRLARNKRQEDLIRALAALRATAIPDARLVLAGTGTDTAPYVDALRALSQRLDVADAVEIPAQRLDDDVIAGYYRSAAVFACSSEHEGFCIPLIEAMAFSLPIVAYAAAAIPETLDGAGVLVDHKDPLVWAALLARLIEDEKLRCSLTSAGRERVELFGDSHIAARLSEALSAIGLAP